MGHYAVNSYCSAHKRSFLIFRSNVDIVLYNDIFKFPSCSYHFPTFPDVFLPFLGHRETGISYRREVYNCVYAAQLRWMLVGDGKETVKIHRSMERKRIQREKKLKKTNRK